MAILNEFQELQGKPMAVETFVDNFGFSREKVQYSVRTLKGQGHKFEDVKAGQLWIYQGKGDTPKRKPKKKAAPKASATITVPAYGPTTIQIDEPALQDEPQGTFQVKGSLVDGGRFLGTVVSITSPGWSDRPYLITEL